MRRETRIVRVWRRMFVVGGRADLAGGAAPPAASELTTAGARGVGVVERLVGEVMGGVHERTGAGEVEQLAVVGRRGQVDELDGLGDAAPFELVALLAADGERTHRDVDGRP